MTQQNTPSATWNRRIVRLTLMNLCISLFWYLLYEEYQTGAWYQGQREFEGVYRLFLVILVVMTLAVWIRLGWAIWNRLQLGFDGSAEAR